MGGKSEEALGKGALVWRGRICEDGDSLEEIEGSLMGGR